MTTDLHQLAAAYALDALDADERAVFEAHLSSCDACSADIESFGAVAANLADASIATPPAHLKADIMTKVAAARQVPPVDDGSAAGSSGVVSLVERRRRRFSVSNMLAVAAAVALIAVGAVVIAGLRGGSGIDDVIAAPDAVVTQLEGESGSVQVVWSAGRDQVALLANDLDELDPGFIYALWAIADGRPIPAGLFDVHGGVIRGVADIDDLTADAWGITIEPEGGSDAPTSDILFFAET